MGGSASTPSDAPGRRERLRAARDRGAVADAVAVVVAALVSAAFLVLSRGYPTTGSDTGIFLTVAGEILDGTRLYAEVADNKDPLFFYAQAAAVAVGGWRGLFAVDILWLALAGCGMLVLVHRLGAGRLVAGSAGALYMALLTGLYFNAGYSGMMGLALLPFVAAAAVAGLPATAGAGVAALALTKITLVPVAAALCLVAAVWHRRELPRVVLRASAGAGAVLAAVVTVLAAAGQLGAYLTQLRVNAGYPAVGLPAGIGRERPWGHLVTAWSDAAPGLRWALVIGVLATLAAASALRWPAPLHRLGPAAGAAAVSTFAVVALGHIWNHHLQLTAFALALLGALALATLGAALRRVPAGARRTALAGGGAAVVLVATFGLQAPSADRLSWWSLPPYTVVSDTLTTAAGPGRAGQEQTWFHLGNDGENGAGAFLPDEWTLACPQFHQYPWHPAELLDPTRACVERERPAWIVVTRRFAIDDVRTRFHARDPRWASAWIRFHGWGLAYLADNCILSRTAPDVAVYSCATAAGARS